MRVLDVGAVVEGAARVERGAVLADPPPARNVEVVQGEADRVDEVVTRTARRVRAVRLQPLAGGEDPAVAGALGLLQVGDVRRRRGRRRPQQHLHDPLAAQHRRGAVPERGLHQHAALPQNATSAVVRVGNAAEVIALDAFDPVVPRQPLVQEGVVGPVQLQQTAVFPHQVVEEELGLAPHGVGQLTAVVGEAEGVGAHLLDILQAQPHRREAGGEGLGAGVGEEAASLRFEVARIGEGATLGSRDQLAVGVSPPQEEGQAGREVLPLQRVDLARAHAAGLALHAEEEMGTDEDRLQRGPDPRLEAAVLGAKAEEVEEIVHLVAVELAAVRARGEPGDDLADARLLLPGRRGSARKHTAPRLEVRHARGVVRSLQGEAHEVREGGRPVAGLRPGEGPVVGTDQVLVRPVHPAHEGGRDPALARADQDRLGADGEVLPALEVDVPAVAEQHNALPVDRDVDVVEALPPPGHERHLEGVLTVGREGVEDADAAPGPERRAFDPLPFVLGDGRRIRVCDRGGRRVPVPDGAPRNVAGSVQVGVHQCG